MKRLNTSELNARKTLLATLQKQVQELQSEIEVNTIVVDPNAHLNLANTLAHIAEKTKHRSLRRICLEALDKTDKKALTHLARSYRNQGIEQALNIIRSKVKQAQEMNSNLTAIVGETYINDLKKLLNSDDK